jgi:hypothetical protein
VGIKISSIAPGLRNNASRFTGQKRETPTKSYVMAFATGRKAVFSEDHQYDDNRKEHLLS